MSNQASKAINAAKHRKQWGRWATMRYLANNSVNIGLYRLASQLEAVEEKGYV